MVLAGYGNNDNRLSLSDEELVITSTVIPAHASGKWAENKTVSVHPHNTTSHTGHLIQPELVVSHR